MQTATQARTPDTSALEINLAGAIDEGGAEAIIAQAERLFDGQPGDYFQAGDGYNQAAAVRKLSGFLQAAGYDELHARASTLVRDVESRVNGASGYGTGPRRHVE